MLFFGHCTIRYRAMAEEKSGADRYNKSMSIGRTSCLQMLSATTPIITTTSVSKLHSFNTRPSASAAAGGCSVWLADLISRKWV